MLTSNLCSEVDVVDDIRGEVVDIVRSPESRALALPESFMVRLEGYTCQRDFSTSGTMDACPSLRRRKPLVPPKITTPRSHDSSSRVGCGGRLPSARTRDRNVAINLEKS